MPDYFSHDYNARHDPKLIKLRMALGQEGIGIFWCLIEMMYEQSGYLLHSQYDIYSDELRISTDVLRKVVEEFNLFESDKIGFWNESCRKRLELRKSKSEQARNAVNTRHLYGRNTDVIRQIAGTSTIKESKVKKRKDIYSKEFEQFWSTYPKKESKATAAVSFNKIPPDTLPAIIAALSWQCKLDQWKKDGGQFVPMPATYLNQRRWEDVPNNQALPKRESILSGVSRE